MKTPLAKPKYQPTEAEIREKALELYIHSGWLPGCDLDNWLQAEAWLRENPPANPAGQFDTQVAPAAQPHESGHRLRHRS